MVSTGVLLIGPEDTPLGAPGLMCLDAASFEVTGTDRVPIPLAVGLADLEQWGKHPSVLQQWCPL